MLRKPTTCGGCSLENLSQGFSTCEGTANNGVLIIGESLGKNELNDGLPFRPFAEAGSVLQTVFKRLNLNRSDFLLWNLVGCQPPYNVLEGASYEESSITHCQVHFNQVFNKFKSKIKVILALGNLPMRYLCPEIQALYIQAKQDKDKSLLKKLSISSLRGYKFESKFPGIPIISSLHPSFIRRTGSVYSGVLLRDLYSTLQIAKGYNEPFKINAITNPSSDDAINFYELCKANPLSPITYDIETPMTVIETDESEVEYKDIEVRDIDSIQFSLNENEGIYLDWIQYKDIAAKILALPNPKLSWNGWQFDQTHLEYHLGKNCINGLNIDLIWHWHHVQPDFNKLGRGLQFATNWFAPNFPAWKHLSDNEPRKYGILDVIATNKIGRGLDAEFNNKRLYPFTKSIQEGFMDDIVKLKPILDDISLRGFPINIEARKIFADKLDIEIVATMERLQEKYPFELRNVTPKQGYKYEPKEIQILTEKFNSIYRDPNNSKSYIIFPTSTSYSLALHKFIEENSRLVDNEKKKDNSGLILKEFEIDGFNEKRWCHIQQFKPTSSPQVIEYIKFKKYKVPKKKDYEKGDKETSSKDELYKLSEDHPEDTFLNDIVLVRELKGMRTRIGSGKKGWQLGTDNRLHTTFLPLGATGQLVSKNPNIQNLASHGNRYSSPRFVSLATELRKVVSPPTGKVILSADWSSFHALTLAFEAEDSLYMRLVRCDIHSFVAAHMLVEDLPRWYSAIKRMKPLETEKDKWLAQCKKYEEGLERIKSLNSWLNYSDEELTKQLSWIKKNFSFIRNTQAKNAILGLGFGMGINHFYNTFRYAFKSKAEPEALHKLIRRLFPKVFIDYHERIRDLADQQTYLISRYGYIRRFYDVYDWRLVKQAPKTLRGDQLLTRNKRTGELWLRKDGVDSNSAIAFNPANDAFGVKKEKMRELYSMGLYKDLGLINEIHDDLMFEMEESKVAEFAPIIKNVMESPALYLKNKLAPEGLITRVEVKVGKNWGSFNDDPKKGELNLEGMKTLHL